MCTACSIFQLGRWYWFSLVKEKMLDIIFDNFGMVNLWSSYHAIVAYHMTILFSYLFSHTTIMWCSVQVTSTGPTQHALHSLKSVVGCFDDLNLTCLSCLNRCQSVFLLVFEWLTSTGRRRELCLVPGRRAVISFSQKAFHLQFLPLVYFTDQCETWSDTFT